MEKILISRTRKPHAVYEKEDVHYFYWPFEVGATEITVGEIRLPILPLKAKDYEPIKTLKIDSNIVVISRYYF